MGTGMGLGTGMEMRMEMGAGMGMEKGMGTGTGLGTGMEMRMGTGTSPLSSALAEDGQEQGWRGDLRGVLGDVPAGDTPPSPHPCPHRDISMGLGTPLVVPPPPVGTCDVSVSPRQDVDIMSSMQIFENTI